MKSFLLTVALSLLALNAYAELNKWVDADGKVHYSDTRPPEVTTETVQDFYGKGKSDKSDTSAPKSYIEREAEWKKSRQEKADAAKKQAEKDKEAEDKKHNCAAARENARVLQDSPRITTYNEKGEREFLDDSARAQRLEEAQKSISENCN